VIGRVFETQERKKEQINQSTPPKNGVIALWTNTRVVKVNIMFHENKLGSIIRSTGTVFYSLLYLNSRQAFNGLKYVYSVISEIVDSLPGNTKNRESTHSWTARVRSGHPCAGGLPLNYNFEYEKCPKYCTTGSS